MLTHHPLQLTYLTSSTPILFSNFHIIIIKQYCTLWIPHANILHQIHIINEWQQKKKFAHKTPAIPRETTSTPQTYPTPSLHASLPNTIFLPTPRIYHPSPSVFSNRHNTNFVNTQWLAHPLAPQRKRHNNPWHPQSPHVAALANPQQETPAHLAPKSPPLLHSAPPLVAKQRQQQQQHSNNNNNPSSHPPQPRPPLPKLTPMVGLWAKTMMAPNLVVNLSSAACGQACPYLPFFAVVSILAKPSSSPSSFACKWWCLVSWQSCLIHTYWMHLNNTWSLWCKHKTGIGSSPQHFGVMRKSHTLISALRSHITTPSHLACYALALCGLFCPSKKVFTECNLVLSHGLGCPSWSLSSGRPLLWWGWCSAGCFGWCCPLCWSSPMTPGLISGGCWLVVIVY